MALLEKRLNDQEKRMDAQDEIIQTNTRDIEKVKEDMVDLRQQPSGDCDSIFNELKEREAKKSNIVIHQLPEPDSTLKTGAQKKRERPRNCY